MNESNSKNRLSENIFVLSEDSREILFERIWEKMMKAFQDRQQKITRKNLKHTFGIDP